jgi:hypothetical protein
VGLHWQAQRSRLVLLLFTSRYWYPALQSLCVLLSVIQGSESVTVFAPHEVCSSCKPGVSTSVPREQVWYLIKSVCNLCTVSLLEHHQQPHMPHIVACLPGLCVVCCWHLDHVVWRHRGPSIYARGSTSVSAEWKLVAARWTAVMLYDPTADTP